MSWSGYILASAFFLALYDLCKKASVRNNAVLPVLLSSTCFGCMAFVVSMWIAGDLGAVVHAGGKTIGLGVLKSVVVAISWIFTFTALKTLPITIATPIRASAPAMVFLAALFIYGEVPTLVQALGMVMVFAGYMAFSWAGKAEGIDFWHNRAVWCAIAGAGMSAVSALLDKFVFQKAGVEIEPVQFWFQVGLVGVYGIALMVSRQVRETQDRVRESQDVVRESQDGVERSGFEWRWTIPLVGILLAGADWLYFNALAEPGAAISVVSLVRRLSVAITFVLGAICFREHNLKRKAIALGAVLGGVALLLL